MFLCNSHSELPLETLTLVVYATMKRIIFVVTFAAALLQLNDAADTGNAPEQQTEGELLSLVGGGNVLPERISPALEFAWSFGDSRRVRSSIATTLA